jgi:hypothetical protein
MNDCEASNSHYRDKPKEYVCASCLEDQSLQAFAESNAEMHGCDYCGSDPANICVARLDAVIEFMGEAIATEWEDPEREAPRRDSSDGGGYYINTFDSETLLYIIGFQVSNENLMADITAAFANHEWCERQWQLLSATERWNFGWDRFQHVVKHQRRYTFWYCKDDVEDVSHPDYLPPADMLAEVESVIKNLKLVKDFPVGTSIWRLQLHPKGESLSDPKRFTPPPIDLAIQANRMSPPGVPMFYGSDDFETAQLELIDPSSPEAKDKLVSGAQFRNLVPLNLLDLTSIPSLPSYFSHKGPFRRHYIHFLNKFVEDLSEPIKKDGRQHIEYVPTQVFTEFVRHIMKGPNGVPVHGIRYSSSINGKPCCVIFATQEECLPCGPLDMVTQKLEFVVGSIKTADASCDTRSEFLAEVEKVLAVTKK